MSKNLKIFVSRTLRINLQDLMIEFFKILFHLLLIHL